MDSLRKKNPTPRPYPREISLKNTPPSIRFDASRAPEIPFGGPRAIFHAHKKPAPQRRRRIFQFLLRTIGIFIFVVVLFFGYFSWKIGDATRSMSIVPEKSAPVADTIHGAASILNPIFHRDRTTLPGESDGRTNILLLGKTNEKEAGQKLTDTIMIASLDFKKKKIALLSLPRDLYVQIPETNAFTKLNALYQFDVNNGTGAATVEKAVSDITGLPIHAFATLDYDGFVRIVDILGGVSIYVDRDLFDPRFPGPNYSYETFKIDKGWHDLDGATALKYVRERHSDPEGDFGRAKRQQAILSAMKNKAFSIKTILDPLAISDIIDTLGKHIRTELSLEDIQSLAAIAGEFDTTNISNAVVDAWKKDSLLRVSHIQVGSVAMFVLLPRTGDWSEVRDLASTIFDLDRLKARRDAIASEDARIAIINNSDTPTLGARVTRFLTEDLDIKHVQIVPPSIEEKLSRNTSVIVRRGGTEALYTTDEISKKLSLTLADPNTLPSADSLAPYDIIVFLGNDLAKRLSFAEDTPEDIQNAEDDPVYRKNLDNALSLQNNTR